VTPTRSKLLRTTVVQAFAQTVVDPSRRGSEDGEDPSSADTRVAGVGAPLDFSPGPPSAVTFLPDVGDVVGGHYKLMRLLGQGMFGKVYVAQRLDVPEHQVALKLLPRSMYAGRNVERELVMLATVGHPHVVQLKDHGTTPDYVWLTMPVYHGQTLAERLEKKGTLSPRQAYDIFVPVARGLEALHAAGLRHQDVKPENIFLAVFGGRVHPILLDLGVAAEKDASFVAGTALFAAPEQVAVLSGLPVIQPLSEKMDTYGLASTLLMALAGPRQFPGETATDRIELAEAHDLRTKYPLGPGALPDVTGDPRDQLDASFRSWLAFEPGARPTMKEMAEQLEVLLEPDAEEVRQEEKRRERQALTILRFKVVFAAMIVLGVAGGAIAFTQRETLRIAADLDRARTDGAKSFDQLETCNAAHARDTQAIVDCKAAQAKSRDEQGKQIEEVMRSGSASQQDRAREAQRFNKALKTCEDNATTAKRVCDDETARILMENVRDKTTLSGQRDEARRLAEEEKGQLASLSAERDQCRAERTTCAEEREALKAAAAKPPPHAAVPVGTAVPAGTSAPIATAAPEPTGPAEPKAPVVPQPKAQPAQAPPVNPKEL
jgi:eukaryotic-like serine/threonine-protein kinase